MYTTSTVGRENSTERLIEQLLDELGGALRTLWAYRPEDCRILYIPGDVEDQYTAEEFDTTFTEVLYETASADYVESLYHLGDLRAMAPVFEQGTLVDVMCEAGNGLLVGIDAEREASIRWITGTCHGWMAGAGSDDPMAAAEAEDVGHVSFD